MISLFWPFISKDDILRAISDTLDTRWIGQGPQVEEFEQALGDRLDSSQAVAVNSGTAALHLAYILAGVSDGDEVITPVLTCTATNHPILYQRGKIVFADIDPKTLLIDPEDVARKITSKTKAIVAVHLGGKPCDMDRLKAVAGDIPIIEDCAQAFGATYKGQAVGTIGAFGCFSFQAIKHFTTGDGGCLVVNTNEKDYSRAKRLRWFSIDRDAKKKGGWQPMKQREVTQDQDEMGYKYQMTDIDAAIGKAQLKNLWKVEETRKKLVYRYRELLNDTIEMQPETEGEAHWLFTIFPKNREKFQEYMKEKGIETNIVQVRNDLFKVFGGKRLDLPGMDEVEDRYVSLPLHGNLTLEEVDYVCDAIGQYHV